MNFFNDEVVNLIDINLPTLNVRILSPIFRDTVEKFELFDKEHRKQNPLSIQLAAHWVSCQYKPTNKRPRPAINYKVHI